MDAFINSWYILLGIHILASVIYYLIVRRVTEKIQAVVEAAIVFLMPVFGLFILSAGRIVYRIFYRGSKPVVHKLNNDNTVFTNITAYDENVIPLNDTFLVDDIKRKRRVFLDAVKQNVLENPKVLRLATHDTDREIAYYAVSMLSNRIEALESAMADSENKLQLPQNENNMLLMRLYAQQLSEYVQQDFVDPLTKKDKRRSYLELLEKLLKIDKVKNPVRQKFYYMEKIAQEIELGLLDDAEKSCNIMLKMLPLDEDSYLNFIKLYYSSRDIVKLRRKVDELKASPIQLSVDALRIIRYWGGAGR